MPKLTLVFEYVEHDIKKYMDIKGSPLKLETEVKPIILQTLKALQYMHAKSIVHRDIKPQNILISNDLKVKLADFGLARAEGIPVKKYSHEAVTLWYRPPDVILGSVKYAFTVDIWSLGCVFAEMVLGYPIFNGKSDADQLARIFRLLGVPNALNWPSMDSYPGSKTQLSEVLNGFDDSNEEKLFSNRDLLKIGPLGMDLLQKMLRYEPSHRITVSDALNHPFFQQ